LVSFEALGNMSAMDCECLWDEDEDEDIGAEPALGAPPPRTGERIDCM
jgi:hypothetical protein